MTHPRQSDIVTVRRCIAIDLDLKNPGGSVEGIHFVPDGGDGYTITPAEAREIATALNTVADEAEAKR